MAPLRRGPSVAGVPRRQWDVADPQVHLGGAWDRLWGCLPVCCAHCCPTPLCHLAEPTLLPPWARRLSLQGGRRLRGRTVSL